MELQCKKIAGSLESQTKAFASGLLEEPLRPSAVIEIRLIFLLSSSPHIHPIFSSTLHPVPMLRLLHRALVMRARAWQVPGGLRLVPNIPPSG